MDTLDIKLERIIPVGGNGSKVHSELEGLGYEESGHIGFASSQEVSAINERLGNVEKDYLKGEDKVSLQEQIDTNAEAIKVLSEGIDPEKIDGLKEVAEYVNEHVEEVVDINKRLSAVEKSLDSNLLSEQIVLSFEQPSYSSDKEIEGLNIGDKATITYVIGDGEEQTANGVVGEQDGFMALSSDGENAILLGQYDNMDIGLLVFLNTSDMATLGGSSAMLITGATNYPTIVIKSLSKASVEYASKEEVEALGERVTALEEGGSEIPSGEPLVATFKIASANTSISVNTIVGATSVDWGDGSAIEDISSATTYTHTYESVGSFVAKFYGVISTVSATFSGNSSIVSAIIPHSVTDISETFRNCTSLLEVKIPNTITWIGSYTFQGCTELTNIEIPNSVTSISMRAFSGCTKLSSVKMPQNDSITFGQSTFYGCTKLTKIELKSTNISNSNNTIFPSTTKIIVPYERLQQYKQALTNHASQIDAYAMASTIDDINAQLTNIIEGEGV